MSQNCLPSVGPNKDESPHPGLDQLVNCCEVLDGEQPDRAPKPEGSLEVGVKVGFLDVL